jgi:hypothetical protein
LVAGLGWWLASEPSPDDGRPTAAAPAPSPSLPEPIGAPAQRVVPGDEPLRADVALALGALESPSGDRSSAPGAGDAGPGHSEPAAPATETAGPTRADGGDAGLLDDADAPRDAGLATADSSVLDAGARSLDESSPFRVRWGEEGLCGTRRGADLRASREALLSGFVTRSLGEAQLLSDPRLDGATLSLVAERLQAARTATAAWMDWPSNVPPPVTVVYADTAQLQSVGCVSAQTIGYFDGRIHLSADAALGPRVLGETVLHEYVHFALVHSGVEKPMWLHEGLATRVAEEAWFVSGPIDFARWLRASHLPFSAMVYVFPHVAEERLALAATYQSTRMVDFLVARRGPQAVRELVRLLVARAVTPDEAFARGSGLSPGELDPQWKAFVAVP